MTATALLAQLGTLGITAKAEGGALHLSPASAIPTDLLADLRARKADVLALLTSREGEANHGPPTPHLASVTKARTGDGPEGEPPSSRPLAQPLPASLAKIKPTPADHAVLAAYRRAAQMRPNSWADPNARPSLGCFCGYCRGQQWWCERAEPKGWRCRVCHPPDGLDVDHILDVRT